jgi:hypothetical protein
MAKTQAEKDASKRWSAKNRDRINACALLRRQQRGDEYLATRRNWYAINKARVNEQRALLYREKRQKVIDMYGGCCACCGEYCYEFMAIDHEGGWGSRHRAELGNNGRGRNELFNWLLAKKRKGIRILCHNCNNAYGYYGYCPHAKTQPTTAD